MCSLPVLIGRGLDLECSHSQVWQHTALGSMQIDQVTFPVRFSGCVHGRKEREEQALSTDSEPKALRRAVRPAKRRSPKDSKDSSGRPPHLRASPENVIQFPVAMAGGSHLFPYRTQKLSLHTLMVLGWRRPGRVGRCRIPTWMLEKCELLQHPTISPIHSSVAQWQSIRLLTEGL